MDELSSLPKPSLGDQPKVEAEAINKGPQMCKITVRIIKSFEYRVSRNIILPVDVARTTVGELKEICRKHIANDAKFKIFRNIEFNTLKIYTQAFGNKTQNLIINIDDNGLLLNDKATLEFAGIRSETELSFFSYDAYKAYAKSPKTKW
ncbi:hypothetical protein IWW37_000703 [Coemansia sp. RSA 2050]|nr:hypothetical protein IWW37_000703 [Coemansia sp. RSA 2050]KAJ2735933.1 hypothetical protein IW152_001231 [Coemansia sp. BCRC 34962]